MILHDCQYKWQIFDKFRSQNITFVTCFHFAKDDLPLQGALQVPVGPVVPGYLAVQCPAHPDGQVINKEN